MWMDVGIHSRSSRIAAADLRQLTEQDEELDDGDDAHSEPQTDLPTEV